MLYHFFHPQIIGNLQWFSLVGYVEITEASQEGPFSIVIEDPQRNRPTQYNLIAPPGSMVTTLGFRVPGTNNKGEPATLVGPDTATLRLATSFDTVDCPILTFTGPTLAKASAKKIWVPDPNNLLETAASHQLYSSGAIASSAGTMRLLAFLQYIEPIDLPSFEYFTPDDYEDTLMPTDPDQDPDGLITYMNVLRVRWIF